MTNKKGNAVLVLTLLLSAIGLAADLLSLLTLNVETLIVNLDQLNKIFQTSPETSTLLASAAKNPKATPLIFVFFVYMMSITIYELRQRIIPDAVTLPGIAIGVGLALMAERPLLAIFVGMFLGLVIPAGMNRIWEAIHGEPGFGQGVIKMLGMIGVFLGPANVLASFVIGIFLTALYILLFLGPRSILRDPHHKVEFGPSLALGAVMCATFPITQWYISLIK